MESSQELKSKGKQEEEPGREGSQASGLRKVDRIAGYNSDILRFPVQKLNTTERNLKENITKTHPILLYLVAHRSAGKMNCCLTLSPCPVLLKLLVCDMQLSSVTVQPQAKSSHQGNP